MATLAFFKVEINGKNYGIETFSAAGSLNKVVRLTKNDGTAYDVEQGWERTTCSCPDYQRRHADLPYSDGCKHVKAMVEIGLLADAKSWEVSEQDIQPEMTTPGSWVEPNTLEIVEAAQELAAGLAHALAELTDDPGAPVRRKPGRKPITDSINWDYYGQRYAAGESYRSLAIEANVSPTKLWNRVRKLGYSPEKKALNL